MKVILKISIMFTLFVKSDQTDIKIVGPGLQPQNIVMPARYFFVNFTSFHGNSYNPDLANNFAVEITGRSKKHTHCRVWTNKLDRKDGTFIVRYKIFETCQDLTIGLYFKSKHIKGSPFTFTGPIQPDNCNCPARDYEKWLHNYGCPASYDRIDKDLKPFNKLNMKQQITKIIKRFHSPESTSFCHYVVKNNKVFRDCYGKHVGFNMFSDNILLSMSRKVLLPDMELLINLGDWPLVRKGTEPLPVFSWCGNDDTIDVVMPTYDITESTLENMGRVTLDTLSVQGGVERPWSQREPRAFWRGRDSRADRLTLIDIARANPDLINASLTNFFFFRDKEAQYGPKQPHVSFFKFFDYKYQINIDGTVASYRLPYLLSGGGMVIKQDSPYYEHFYDQLKPWEHYVPVSRNLKELKERILWARGHDDEARKIAENARAFAVENLLPQHVICYHAVLFLEWSKRIDSEVTVPEGMEYVPQPPFACDCDNKEPDNHEEL